MHYFEKPDIIGKLYNEDGSEYKPTPKKNTSNVQRTPTPVIQAKPTPTKPRQFNLFDMMAQTDKPAEEESEDPVEEMPTNDEIIEMNIEETQQPYTLQVNKSTGEVLSQKPAEKKTVPLQASPLYQKYMRFQNQYPHAVIAYRLGDFLKYSGTMP